MAPQPKIHEHGSRGRIWVNASAGTWVVNDPILEWGYQTPRFPWGVTNTALGRVDAAVQIETALVWFSMNFRPYERPAGVPILTLDTPGLGLNVGHLAPERLIADVVLRREFGGVLPEEVIAQAARQRPGVWMRVEVPLPPEVPFDGRLDSILRELAELKNRIEQIAPLHGGIGHNHPPAGHEVEGDRAGAVSAIFDLETKLPAATKGDKPQIESSMQTLATYGSKVGSSALEGLAKGVGQEAGKAVWRNYLASLDLWHLIHQTIIAIAHFIATL